MYGAAMQQVPGAYTRAKIKFAVNVRGTGKRFGRTLDAVTLSDYIGKYELTGAVVDFTLKGDHPETQITGQPAFPVFAKDKFFLKVVDAQLDFEREGGRASSSSKRTRYPGAAHDGAAMTWFDKPRHRSAAAGKGRSGSKTAVSPARPAHLRCLG
jgi:hypothetical protein